MTTFYTIDLTIWPLVHYPYLKEKSTRRSLTIMENYGNYIDTNEAKKRIGCSAQTIRNLIKAGKLQALHISGYTTFNLIDRKPVQ